jgi:hypothetical protein
MFINAVASPNADARQNRAPRHADRRGPEEAQHRDRGGRQLREQRDRQRRADVHRDGADDEQDGRRDPRSHTTHVCSA